MTSSETTKKTKVLFLITKARWGGAQRYVYDLATNLPREQYEVVVAVGEDGPLTTKLHEAEIPVRTITHLQRDVTLARELRAVRDTAALIRSERPQLLHVNSSKAGLIGAVLGRLLGVPRVIFTCHGWAFNEDRPGWQRVLLKLMHWITVCAAHRTITVSDAVRGQMNWPGAAVRMVTVRNGASAPDFLPRHAARQALVERIPTLASFHADPWLLSIGELHPTKQHHVSIAAVRELVTRGHQVRLIILGEGEVRQALEAAITVHDLSHHVFLAGHVPEAARYLPAAECFVLASRSEALGYVVLEAAQAGVPIVASRVGGIPEIVVDEREAKLVPAGDPLALAEAIHEVLHEPSHAVAMATRAKEHSHTFTIASMMEATRAVYER